MNNHFTYTCPTTGICVKITEGVSSVDLSHFFDNLDGQNWDARTLQSVLEAARAEYDKTTMSKPFTYICPRTSLCVEIRGGDFQIILPGSFDRRDGSAEFDWDDRTVLDVLEDARKSYADFMSSP